MQFCSLADRVDKLELAKSSNSSSALYGNFKCRRLMALFNPYREARALLPSRFVFKAVALLGQLIAKAAPDFLVMRFERQMAEQIESCCAGVFAQTNRVLEEIVVDLKRFGYY